MLIAATTFVNKLTYIECSFWAANSTSDLKKGEREGEKEGGRKPTAGE